MLGGESFLKAAEARRGSCLRVQLLFPKTLRVCNQPAI